MAYTEINQNLFVINISKIYFKIWKSVVYLKEGIILVECVVLIL